MNYLPSGLDNIGIRFSHCMECIYICLSDSLLGCTEHLLNWAARCCLGGGLGGPGGQWDSETGVWTDAPVPTEGRRTSWSLCRMCPEGFLPGVREGYMRSSSPDTH